jgi:hypothetical protein
MRLVFLNIMVLVAFFMLTEDNNKTETEKTQKIKTN